MTNAQTALTDDRLARLGIRSAFHHIVALAFACCFSVRNIPAQTLDDSSARTRNRSDPFVLDSLFAQQHVRESGISVCQRSAAMQPEQAFVFLSDWVLPSKQHRGFRIPADFASENFSWANTNGISKRARIVSPAIDLIELSKRVHRADELRDLINASDISSPLNRSDQTAMLALQAIANDDQEQAHILLEQFFTSVLSDRKLLDTSRDAVLLCADRASESVQLSKLIREWCAAVAQQFIGDVERSPWHRHFWDVNARVAQQADLADIKSDKLSSLATQWHAVSRTTAFEHGLAFPDARWSIAKGIARNLSSQGDDFLFYASPLQGGFDVETDVTGFGFRDSQLMVAGTWIAPIYDHQHYDFGNVRGQIERVEVSPPLADSNKRGLIHCRTRVRDDSAVTYLNGRRIHAQPLTNPPNPWLAIRSSYRHDGGVDDLRITGTPTIPDTISLVESPQLLGWYDYYGSVGQVSNHLSDWRATVNASPLLETQTTEITSPIVDDIPEGSFSERLLVYARPIMEDGAIEYEFWYTPGKTVAHPTIGRKCFLLDADGVKLHQVTDGSFERSTLRPDNKIPVGPLRKLPLRPDTWNSLRLEQKGDSLKLILNGTEIYQASLIGDRHERTFGLFHYADQTNLRARKLKWTGTWPKELPGLSQQALVSDRYRFLEESAAKLNALFTHHFDENSMIDGAFVMVEGDPSRDVQATEDGVILSRQGREGYQAAMLAPALDVAGDFDATVTFDQLKCDSPDDKISSVRMNVICANDTSDFSSIIHSNDRSDEKIIQCLKMQTIQGSERRHYFSHQPMECYVGRLRLSRRGGKIYYLISENDSTQFRVVGEEDFAPEDLADHGIRFGPQVQGVGSNATVRFTKLEVRADQLGGLAIDGHDKLIAKLNTQRDQLPTSLEHDFTKAGPSEVDFFRWTDEKAWDGSSKGLEIEGPGSDEWSSAGLSIIRRFIGDFDILFRFDKPLLATPMNGERSEVYLQIELGDEGKSQLSLMLRKDDSGGIYCMAQMRTRINNESRYSNLGTLAVSDPDYFRLLRRGRDAYFIVGKDTNQREYLLASTKVSESMIGFHGARIMVHTGGAGRTSSVLAKSILVKAQAQAVMNVAPVFRTNPTVPPNPAKPKTIYESFRDLFR